MLLRVITGVSMAISCVIFACFDMALWLLPVMFAGFWLGAVLLAFVFLCVICSFVDLNKPQETDSKFYRFFMYLYIEALMMLVGLKMEVSGLEKTPKDGRFLLVCNHQNESDPGILMYYFKKSQLAFISKKENATMFAVGKFMHKTLCQMIDRENDREALKTILKCIQMIKEDLVSVAVFPEGGIKVYGKLSPFRPGVFKIAQKANVPIVVCTLKGTDELFHNIAHFKRTHVRLHLVDVIPAEDLKGRTTVDIAEQVHGMMLADLGPEYEIENT
ncbi:MAG: 1-acyl-sn-glycerol-3-phosphate acyltransferase [Oscillospiraceae bacterium]|nr:1-acyl-sn-glycerol-3-phosphate acyltransferase [Oscillospiraceae bacterium]